MISRIVIFLTTLFVASPALAHAPSFHMEVIQFPSDPPTETLVAPGGGRVLTPAILYTPASGANVHGPAIVMLDEGPGSHPLRPNQATRYAAESLASHGYTVLSLYSGQERNYPLMPFSFMVWPVKSALDYLEMSGYEDFVLEGQGYGAIVAAQYLATQPDELLDNGGERRVKAVIMINPLTDLRAYPGAGLEGADYDQKVAVAEVSVASKRGLYPAGHTLTPGQGADVKTDPWVAAGPFIAPAEAFLEYWGPKAEMRNRDFLEKIKVPTLFLTDGTAAYTSASTLQGVKEKTGADLVAVNGQEQVPMKLISWLKAHGLGVRPSVTIKAVDVKTAGGQDLYGVVYLPSGAINHAKPAVILLHGRASDTIQSSVHWMGWRLAQKGYVAFAPSMRISGTAGFEQSTLSEVSEDVGHWVDKASTMGFKHIVLAGHSNGGIWLSNYISLSHDPRVIGTIYFAPTRDGPSYTEADQGKAAYAEQVQTAKDAVSIGHGMDSVIGLLSARAYLDNNGPDARTVHTARVKEFTLPGIAFSGAMDPLMSPEFITEFKSAYKGPLTTIRYDDGSHGFRENKDRVISDTAAWLDKTFPSK